MPPNSIGRGIDAYEAAHQGALVHPQLEQHVRQQAVSPRRNPGQPGVPGWRCVYPRVHRGKDKDPFELALPDQYREIVFPSAGRQTAALLNLLQRAKGLTLLAWRLAPSCRLLFGHSPYLLRRTSRKPGYYENQQNVIRHWLTRYTTGHVD